MGTDIVQLVHAERQQFDTVCSDRSIQFDREAGFAIQALQNNEYLAKVSMNNPQSLRAAVINVAAIGISLNPAKKLAYLVPRDGKVCLDISYMGLMHIAQQTGAVMWSQAGIVRQNDTFELQGIEQPPIHKFNPFDQDRGDIIGVYVVVKTGDGDYLTHAMPVNKVNDIRDRSSAWKAYKAKGTSCPWVTDYEEMVKKTCVKQASKYWPRRERLDEAIHNLNIEADEGIVIESETRRIAEAARALPEFDETERANLIADLEIVAKEQGIDAYADSWANLTKEQRKMIGADEHERLKALAPKVEEKAEADE